MTRIVYIVHDLNDPAVARRVRMLHAGGAQVRVAGFYRGLHAPEQIDGAPVTALARTADAKLGQRVLAVLGAVLRPARLRSIATDADVIIGRNLEALAVAVRLRAAVPRARLVYECLDIHRLLLSRSRPARVLQAIEAGLLRRVDLLIVSSPAFLRDYFARRPLAAAASLLVENKVLALDADGPQPGAVPAGPPWTIGWLGNLRCRRTLQVLVALARRHEGRIQILVAGRPSLAVFDDLPGEIAAAPHCRYLGPYSVDEQAAIYGQCHFAWTIDWFEEGFNSAWLLPNRLYEAQAFGVVPIALRSVETGRWLEGHGTGMTIDDALVEFDGRLKAIDMAEYRVLRAAVLALPRETLVASVGDCAALVQAIAGA